MRKTSRLLREMNKRYKKYKIIYKTALVFYILIFTINYLTSTTTAYFTSKSEANFKITAGEWEDKSRLGFIDRGNENIKGCPPQNIEVTLKNVGEGDMLTSSTYEVYYVKNGEPRVNGKKLDLPDGEGIVPPLKKGQEIKLSYNAEMEGFYEFKVNQSNKELTEKDLKKGNIKIWSIKSIVDCKNGNVNSSESIGVDGNKSNDTDEETSKNDEIEVDIQSNKDTSKQDNENTNNETSSEDTVGTSDGSIDLDTVEDNNEEKDE